MISSLPNYSVFISLSSEKEKNMYQKTRAIGSGQSDYPRTPQHTPGHPRTALFVYSIYYMSV